MSLSNEFLLFYMARGASTGLAENPSVMQGCKEEYGGKYKPC